MINREVQNLVYDIKMIPNQSKHLIQKYNIYLILDKILFRFPPNSYLTLLIQIGNSDITLRSPSNVKTNPFPMNFKWKELINVVFDKEHLHAAANHIVFSISIHGQNNQIISNGQLKINPCLFEKPEMQNNRPFLIDIPNSNSPLMIYTSIHLLPYQNQPPQKFAIFKSFMKPVSVINKNRIKIEPDNLSNLLSDIPALSDDLESTDYSPINSRPKTVQQNNNQIEFNRPREYREEMDPKLAPQNESPLVPQANTQFNNQQILKQQIIQQNSIQQTQIIKQRTIQQKSFQQTQIFKQQIIKQKSIDENQIISQESIDQNQIMHQSIEQQDLTNIIQPQIPLIEQPAIQEKIEQILQSEPVILDTIDQISNELIQRPVPEQPVIEKVELNDTENNQNPYDELERLQAQLKRNEEIIKMMMNEIPPDVLAEIAASIPGLELPSIDQPQEPNEQPKETEQLTKETEQLTKETEQLTKETPQKPEIKETKKERDPIYNEIEEISCMLNNICRFFCYLQTIPPEILLEVLPPFEDDQAPQQQNESSENTTEPLKPPETVIEQPNKENEQPTELSKANSTEESHTMDHLKEELNALEAELNNNVRYIYQLLQLIPPEVLSEVLQGMPPLEIDNEVSNININPPQEDSIKLDIPPEQNDNSNEITPNQNIEIDKTNEKEKAINSDNSQSDFAQELENLVRSAENSEQAFLNIMKIVPPDVLFEVMKNMPPLNEDENSKENQSENSVDLNVTQKIPFNIISEIQNQLSNENPSDHA